MNEKKQIATLIGHYLNCEISSAGLALYLHLFRIGILQSGGWFHTTDKRLIQKLCIGKDILRKLKKELVDNGFVERKRDAGKMWYRFIPLY